MQSVSNAWKALYTQNVVPRSKLEVKIAATGGTLTFTDADITEMNIDLFCDLCSFNLPSAKLIVKFDNSSGAWDADNASGYYPKLNTNQIITVRIGYEISGSTQWISGGTYFLSEWKTSKKDQSATITAVDLIQAYILPTPFKASMLGLPWNAPVQVGSYAPSTTRYRELDAGNTSMLCDAIGIPVASGNQRRIRVAIMETEELWDEDEQEYVTYNYYPRLMVGHNNPSQSEINNYNCAEVLQYLTNSAPSAASPYDQLFMMYLTRDGFLDIKPREKTLQSYDINAFNTYQFDINAERNIKDVNYEYTAYGAYSDPHVVSSTLTFDTDGRTITNTNPSCEQLNYLMVYEDYGHDVIPINNIANLVGKILVNHLIVTGEFRADPRLDVGDKVTFSASGTSYDMYVTELKYKYNGVWKANFTGRIIENGV